MSEQQDVIEELEKTGILEGVRWAYSCAVARALDYYSEDDGHDATLLGTLRYTLFRDRLDRVFHCERYAVPSGDDAADLDQLFARLSPREIEAMPRLAGLVTRNDLNNSPGWIFNTFRLLLVSSDYGELHQIPWSRKSPTKQQVATQRNLEPPPPSLFDEFDEFDEDSGDWTTMPSGDNELDLTTFVIANSLDPLSQRHELMLGRPRLNTDSGPAWHWLQDLLVMPSSDRARRMVGAPLPAGHSPVPDAPVRLRRQEGQHQSKIASDTP